jgi:hypothetical protein
VNVSKYPAPGVFHGTLGLVHRLHPQPNE